MFVCFGFYARVTTDLWGKEFGEVGVGREVSYHICYAYTASRRLILSLAKNNVDDTPNRLGSTSKYEESMPSLQYQFFVFYFHDSVGQVENQMVAMRFPRVLNDTHMACFAFGA
jgi:hypothetical protein